MSFFKPSVKYKQTIKCKKCGKEVLVTDAFCPECGTKQKLLEKDIKNKKFKIDDIRDLYNFYYNSGDQLISLDAMDAINVIIKLMYGGFPRETEMIINSSLRSGYAVRVAEKKIFPNERITTEINLSELKKKFKEVYEKFKLFSKNDRAINIMLIMNELSTGSFINYGKKIIAVDYLHNIIKDNLNYLIPLLDQIYVGDRYLSIGGFPHLFKQEIKLTEEIKNGWIKNISLDTVGGYCIKLSEEILEEIT